MATITSITSMQYNGEGQPMRAIQTKQASYYLQQVQQAYDEGKFIREPAGPGWGEHNALLRPEPGNLEVFEPWYGAWLVTIED